MPMTSVLQRTAEANGGTPNKPLKKQKALQPFDCNAILHTTSFVIAPQLMITSFFFGYFIVSCLSNIIVTNFSQFYYI